MGRGIRKTPICINCDNCGKNFESVKTTEKLCSLECKAIRLKRKQTRNYERNREKKIQKAKNWQGKYPDRHLDNWYKRNYGISKECFEKMVEAQNNLCAICNKEETRASKFNPNVKINLAIDHCHKTGKIRELLCGRCNKAIGAMEDSLELLQSAISYLKKHQG